MFGKGVYFADMVSKSANYCRTSKTDNIGVLLLCEVALGDMYVFYTFYMLMRCSFFKIFDHEVGKRPDY